MSSTPPTSGDLRYVDKQSFASLPAILQSLGYTLIGPRVEQEAVVYGPLQSIDELPIGWADDQQPGQYRLTQIETPTYFGFAVGPHSWKAFLFPPRATLSNAEKVDGQWRFEAPSASPPRQALLGVRACELAAIRAQDRIFLSGDYVDSIYAERRRNTLIIAVNCTSAAKTCFCTSMGTGPRCESGFDIALTELDNGFLVEAATADGESIVAEFETSAATLEQQAAARDARQGAVDQIEKSLDTKDIRDLLLSNLEHERWDAVADRCLSCTNCTMVCPTCFCSSVEEVSDLTGDHVERRRQWDSCFNWDFSYMNGGNVRDSIRARYRQWLTHKLASWWDQFGESGCVGCGRCITWCPVGIDLTEEVAAIRGDSE